MSPPVPLITVILPHYRCEDFLSYAVSSVLSQTIDDLNLLLIDDHSPSNRWLEVLSPYFSDQRLQLYQTDVTVGPYRIYNRIIPRIKSPYVGFQDADDVSISDRFARLLTAIRKTGAKIVGSSYFEIDGHGRLLRKRKMRRYANFWEWLGKTHLVHHPTALICNDIYHILGGYDGSTFFGGDTDFFLRAAQLFRIQNIPACLYFYRIRSDSLTGSVETGLGSEQRKQYLDKILKRQQAWRLVRGRKELVSQLWAQPNNIDFNIQPIDVHC